MEEGCSRKEGVGEKMRTVEEERCSPEGLCSFRLRIYWYNS